MARMQRLVLLLLVVCAAAASTAASGGGGVDTYSFPAFNATTEGIVAVTNSSITGFSLLFHSAASSDEQFSSINSSEGFLLLSRRVGVWRAGDVGRVPEREASFKTSFSLAGSSPVAFVVLQDMYPPFLNPDGFRGPANVTFAPDDAASGSLAAVEAGVVRAYGPFDPAVGLNVTVTSNGMAPSRTVWIEYDAVAHRLSVYVAAAGASSRPRKATLDATVRLAAGRRTTQNASVGFFAGAIRDVIVGVRGWNMTVERLDDPSTAGGGDGRKKGASWVVVVLLAVLGSVAAIL